MSYRETPKSKRTVWYVVGSVAALATLLFAKGVLP